MGTSYQDLRSIDKSLKTIFKESQCLFLENNVIDGKVSNDIIENFKNKNSQYDIKMIELGNQTLKPKDEESEPTPNKSYRVMNYNRLPAKMYFSSIGINHTSIDTNGKDGALPLNLADPTTSKKYNNFDILTNFGTSEHVYDQYECWKNIHNFIKTGGVFCHAVPATGYWYRHGSCYAWHDESFFKGLATLNNYEILDLGRRGSPLHDYVKIFCNLKKKNNNDFISREEFSKLKLHKS